MARATAAGVLGETLAAEAHLFEAADHLAVAARTRDLCIMPLGAPYDELDELTRSVIFASGHPVLLFRSKPKVAAADAPGRVVVAWDGSRCAARAMADALPILIQAREVQLLTVAPETHNPPAASIFEAQRYLKAHGVKASVHEVAARGRTIGHALEAELLDRPVDLLVMGAYGHSRLRELMLGGATEHMICKAPTPIFLSH